MSEERTNFGFEEEKESTENTFESFNEKTGPMKKHSLIGLHRKKSKKKHWKPVQNLRYLEFLKRHGHLFERDREDKRVMKINLMMSNFVKTKSSTQCRSHHQKMEVHYKSIAGIIAYFQQELFGTTHTEQPKKKPTNTEQELSIMLQEESQLVVDNKNQEEVLENFFLKDSQDIDQYLTL